MKRKDPDLDLDDLHNDFSEFSLSSPARKIRRLDAELPPIMEEEDESPEFSCSAPPAFMEESELDTVNDKAIVLFKPLNSPFLNSSSSNLSVSVDSDLISGFKDQFIRATTQQQQKRTTIGIDEDKAVSSSNKECLAVVPWAPLSHLITPPTTSGIEIPTTEPSELAMEAEDTMEIEDTHENTLQFGQSSDGYGGIASMGPAGEGLPQWQQQHCMVPQPPHNTSTPITWFQ